MRHHIEYILLLSVFLILQIIWFNHIRLFGYYTPIVFIYPLLILPLLKNESLNLLLAFFTGLFLDTISNTGGIFAATAVFITYVRKIYFMIFKNPAQKLDYIQIANIAITQKILYFSIFVLMAQIMIYALDAFNIGLLILKWKIIIINTLISIFFIVFFDLIFFNPAKK